MTVTEQERERDVSERTAEQERLRFEGDLDKWMKTLGAGITGYQPEAYTLMDMAVDELVKLRLLRAQLLAALKLAKDHSELEDEVLDIVDEAIKSAEPSA